MVNPAYRFDQLHYRNDDEETILYAVRAKAEAAINQIGQYSPPRIQLNDIRVFFEPSSQPRARSWLVTIRHGHRFVVSVDLRENQWTAKVVQWEVVPMTGYYFIKDRSISGLAKNAPQDLKEIYHTTSHGQPIGRAAYVGKTHTTPELGVYWLYDAGQPTDPLPRQIAGNYVLKERHFIPLPQSEEVIWIKQSAGH